jgi:hypothetical protein
VVRAQTIQIYLPLGDPAGMRVASLTTRTVRVFEVPRPLLSEFLATRESGQVGVYYLFGATDDDSTQCYIGQSGNVGTRLQQHAKSRDFWTAAMVAVSLTNEWTSTHAAYLEWLSIGRAVTAGRYSLLNGNQASNPFTPEPLEADCQEFLETIAVLLATLGAPVLESVQPRSGHHSDVSGTETAPEQLFFQERGSRAVGYQTPEGLLVLAGSQGRSEMTPAVSDFVARRRAALVSEGVVRATGSEWVFVKDHLLTVPPSLAACSSAEA